MIALVDCNNFFASCERLFRPELAHQPVAVLSNNDGCVVARSNEVKALGVPMGVPLFKVRDIMKRNNVKLFSSNFALYSNISQRVLAELTAFSPRLEVYSIDEAFMDIAELAVKDYEQWGSGLKQAIQQNVGMPVSVGIAPTKTLAKLAAGWSKKHSGVCFLDPKLNGAQYQVVLQNSDIQAVWGIGRQTAKKLLASGVRTPWQFIQVSRRWLKSTLGVNGERMYDELRGTQHFEFEDVKHPQKSIIASRSFGQAVQTQYELENALASFTAQAAARLRRFEQVTELFGVYLRGVDREGASHNKVLSVRMMPPTNDTSELTEAALTLSTQLFSEDVRYKKAGVFAYQLTGDAPVQRSLLDAKTVDERNRRKRLMEAMDEINHKFGAGSVQLASINTKLQRWHGKHELRSPAYTTSWLDLPLVKG